MRLPSIERFMAIGAHSDDVDLRCGGTFARLTREGKVGCYVVTVENARVGPHFPVRDSYEALAIRRQESTEGARILGASRLEWLTIKSYVFNTPEAGSRVYPSFDSTQALQEELKEVILDGLPPITYADRFSRSRNRLIGLIEEFSPDVVFTHSPDDRNHDHYGVSRFVELIVRERNEQGSDIELCLWEPGGLGPIAGFVPNFFVELSEQDVETKQRALDCYISQYPDGMVGTFAADRARAYGRLVGLDYAEDFHRGSCASRDIRKGRSEFIRDLERGLTDRETYNLDWAERPGSDGGGQ
jgi:LmbE family N-acetylglucosaminyl deacetylase